MWPLWVAAFAACSQRCTSRGGLDVAVLEAGRPGEHASTKNFGGCGRNVRLKFSQLVKCYGLETAKRVHEEAKGWADYTADFIAREEIDCGFYRNERVIGAHCPAAYDAAARELDSANHRRETSEPEC